jgi:hypothetical protein
LIDAIDGCENCCKLIFISDKMMAKFKKVAVERVIEIFGEVEDVVRERI